MKEKRTATAQSRQGKPLPRKGLVDPAPSLEVPRISRSQQPGVDAPLPNAWQWKTIRDLVGNDGVFVDGDWIESKDQDPSGDVRLIQLADVGDGVYRDKSDRFMTRQRADQLRCTFLMQGDVLIARMPDPLGRACVFPGDEKSAVTVVDVAIVRSTNGTFDHRWLVYFLNAYPFRSAVEALQAGSTRKRISRGNLATIPLPVPPLLEQHQIVAEIDKQFTRLDAGIAALQRVQANLKRYRATVLKSACEGRLTLTSNEWREVPLSDLIGTIGQGWSPKCDLTREPLLHEWAIITTTAVQPMQYIDNQGKLLPPGLTARTQLEIEAGDFLMTRKGPRKRASVACLVRDTRPRLMVCDTVYRFRCDETRVHPGYLELALNSPRVVEAIDMRKAGINESGVSLTHDKLGSVVIPVPPLEEQGQIVAEVRRLLSLVNQLETAVSIDLQRAVSLRQSILTKAFAGELLSQSSALPVRVRVRRSAVAP
jgi:type I restriction enzyme S subunit